jgi:hypothetical protein
MANVWAIHAVGDSLVTYLRNTYEDFVNRNAPTPTPEVPNPINPYPNYDFQLLSSGGLDEMENEADNVLSLYLYRININEHLRNVRQGAEIPQRKVPLSLDLHYLMTVWSRSAADEQLMLAWAMRQLHSHPILDQSYLTEMADWDREEVVQLIPAELSHEDMMRIWDTLKPPYRLSFGYVARVVRIESEDFETAVPVLATRFAWGEPQEMTP